MARPADRPAARAVVPALRAERPAERRRRAQARGLALGGANRFTPRIAAALPRRVAPNGDVRKRRENRRKAMPDPQAQVFETRLVEALQLVEQPVIERAAQLPARLLKLREIDDEPGMRIRFAAHRDFDL